VAAVDAGVNRVVIDCSEWADLDLMVLSSLVACATTCSEKGVEFELENLGAAVRSGVHALHVADRLGIA